MISDGAPGFKKVLFSVATSTANLLDASDTDSESESEEEISRYGKQKNVSGLFLQNLTQGTKISIFVHLIMTHDAC